MKYLLLFLLPVVLLTACGEEGPVLPPDNVLNEDAMVEVMLDLQLIEGAYHKRVIKADNTRASALDAYVQVYQKHSISQAEFDSSYSWYLDDPERMEKVLDRVMEELSKMQAEKQAELD